MKPRMYTDPDVMLRRGKKYFKEKAEEGKPITIFGLVLHLGFASEDTLSLYQKRPEFAPVVNFLKTYIKNDYCQKLFQTGPKDKRFNQTSIQFALRATMGLRDLSVTETINSHKPTDIDFSKLTEEEAEKLDEILRKARK